MWRARLALPQVRLACPHVTQTLEPPRVGSSHAALALDSYPSSSLLPPDLPVTDPTWPPGSRSFLDGGLPQPPPASNTALNVLVLTVAGWEPASGEETDEERTKGV